MDTTVYLSTAYLPPIEYVYHIIKANKVVIEKEENYQKQTFRNRCNILSANGLLSLSVPVLLNSGAKTPIKDAHIDYSKRWQQIHIRAIKSAYGSAPFFIYFFDDIERIISSDCKYLLDLNNQLLETILGFLKINRDICFTESFTKTFSENYKENYTESSVELNSNTFDHRFDISPKIESHFEPARYQQLFASSSSSSSSLNRLSIIDMLFNCGEFIE